MKYIIKDDFLNQADYENIKNIILGDKFPWYFQHGVAYHTKDKSQFFWGHTFFKRNQGITSAFYKTLDPILKKIKFKALIRVKANLYSNQGKIIEHETHSDFPFRHKSGLFSLNTCNGFTTLADGTKIESVGNRILFFDASKPHHSSTCTDASVRVNININYF